MDFCIIWIGFDVFVLGLIFVCGCVLEVMYRCGW